VGAVTCYLFKTLQKIIYHYFHAHIDIDSFTLEIRYKPTFKKQTQNTSQHNQPRSKMWTRNIPTDPNPAKEKKKQMPTPNATHLPPKTVALLNSAW